MYKPNHNDFLLDSNIIFLNHGSFGACPKRIFERYQQWQLELEHQPVAFLGRAYDTYMDDARRTLAQYLGCADDDLIFVPNATVGVNLVARSLSLAEDDEILTSDHEYGAMDKLWHFIAKKTGANYRQQKLAHPFIDVDDIADAFWQGVTSRTRVIFLSHITSPTALILPIEQICARAREAGIITIIDGAHAPGQIDLNLSTLGADFYTGNCHKWLCAPKNAGFLYVNTDHQSALEPLIVSWGYDVGASFTIQNQWQGTQDISAYLTVPDAIAYQREYHWEQVRARCHALACYTAHALAEVTGLPALATDEFYAQMVAIPLPNCDTNHLKTTLYDDYRIEVPITQYDGRNYVRVSFQAYNTPDDADALIEALTQYFA